MLIAVDPRVIPLGSKVLLLFENKSHKRYNGVYTARDTGGAIKGNKIDLYMGDFGKVWEEHPSVPAFGRVKAKVIILKKGE